MKKYKAINHAPFMVDPGVDLRWIPIGYGTFEADINPVREAFLLKAGLVEIVQTKAPAKVAEAKAADAAKE